VKSREVVTFFRERHLLASREADPRIGVMACGTRVALGMGRCLNNPEHRIIFPECPNHGPVTNCPVCFHAD
jgi:hypothetical protein